MPGRHEPAPPFDPQRADALLEAIRARGLDRAFKVAQISRWVVTAWLERGKSERAEDADCRDFLKAFGRAIRDWEAGRRPPGGK